jgi:uncharacterized protein (TIGR02996 family)
MSNEQGLLDAIHEHPHDDVPRLVYADWLDDQGGPDNEARAELIRVQCQLDQLPGNDPRFDSLQEREAELRQTWGKKWWAAMPKGCRRGNFHRGFPMPSLIAFSLPGLVRLGEERLRAAPLWRYHYGVHGREIDLILDWPWAHRLDLLPIRDVPEGRLERIVECDNLRNVSDLAFIEGKVATDDLRQVLDVWEKRHLCYLRVPKAPHGNSVEMLVNHPAIRSLRILDVSDQRMTKEDVDRFTRGRHLTNLITLNLGGNHFGDEGLSELLAWPSLSKVRWLQLGDNDLTNEGARLLAECPALANLRMLFLGNNRIGLGGARALADSPHLKHLQRLGLYQNPASTDPQTVRLLKKRFRKAFTF